MWQFRESIRGIAEGCRVLGIPVTGGNVSFYNQTGDVAIHPTPVIGVLGVMEDVSARTPSGFRTDAAPIFLLGSTRDELDGSEWAHVVHGHLGGRPPVVDLAHEQRLSSVLVRAAESGLLDAAHDLSEGGLAQALSESVLRFGVGARVSVQSLGVDAFTALFSESSGRVLVSVTPGSEAAFLELVGEEVPLRRLGEVDDSVDGLRVEGLFDIDLETLRRTHQELMPSVFGR